MAIDLLLQTPGTPVIYAALSRLVRTNDLHTIKIAVAFATKPGVELLTRLLDEHAADVDVLALIGLDRSMTEPDALEMLTSNPRVELRVFESASNSMFHAKAYFFETDEAAQILVGSCNLSAAALMRNRESAYVVDAPEGSIEDDVWSEWWESVWDIGSPCDAAKIADYAKTYDPAKSAPSDTQDVKGTEPETVSSEDSDRLWMGTGSMTGGGATQLEFPKETVGFFLDLAAPPSSLELTLVRGSSTWPDNQMAFYENDMWRVNLSSEIPEVAQKDLAYKYVLFRRTSEPDTYHFEVVDDYDVVDLRAASIALGQYGQTSTRDFGWL